MSGDCVVRILEIESFDSIREAKAIIGLKSSMLALLTLYSR